MGNTYFLIKTDCTYERFTMAKHNFDSLKKRANMDFAEHALTVIDDVEMLLDEEGKLEHKPLNLTATLLYKWAEYDFIVGDVILCTLNARRDNFSGFTQAQADSIEEFIKHASAFAKPRCKTYTEMIGYGEGYEKE